jgi:hypothetical protein
MAVIWWVLIAQTLAVLPAMTPGTEVKVVLPDLITVLGSAVVEEGRLVFDRPLPPGSEVRLLFITRDTERGSTAAALHDAPFGRVSPTGDDILVQFAGLEAPISLKVWLAEEHGIELVLPPPPR